MDNFLTFQSLYRSTHIFTRQGSDWNSAEQASHYVGFVCVAFRSQGFFLKFCREKQHRQNPRNVTLARHNFNRNLSEWKYALTCIGTERLESYPWTIVPWSILSDLEHCQSYFSRIWFIHVIGWNNLYFNQNNIGNITGQGISFYGKVRFKFCPESVTLRSFWMCWFPCKNFKWNPWLLMLFRMILHQPPTWLTIG